ncbi:protein SAWADEE HOMEODOMAIN [Cocos nucifera]|uniref:Protein SAWADEE HOMEODOMAIN n=1 Tax=Cocos nucifera TaxID=13894 RepID=A0A8K0IG87_COCNU|nr:protein SAWADEE HOMEODOMAIN [Cocos nucifera]
MGRPPHGGGPVFRFTHNEVVEMDMCLQEVNNAIPAREVICALAEKFSKSAERAGKIAVQPKQVWNWFQNRRYAQRAKLGKAPGKLSISPMPRDESLSFRNVAAVSAPSGRNSMDTPQVEFEAKSARDGAWYDVAAFLSHRMFETGDPEVRVRFSGFGVEEDEWVNVRRCVRQRSLPCEAAECVAVLPGDLILCFQEGKEQALYFDAHVLDAQRRRHDIRGCRCRFLVRYDHDQSEEIVPLRKVCRRPETDYRLQLLQASKASGSVDLRALPKDPSMANASKDAGLAAQRTRKQHKLMDVNTDEVTIVPVPHPMGMQTTITTAVENSIRAAPDVPMDDAALNAGNVDKPQEGSAAGG